MRLRPPSPLLQGAPGADELAKKLANPLASMISVPFQSTSIWGGGPAGEGFQWKMHVQPVIPVSLNDDFKLIVRTMIPVISQKDIAGTKANPSGRQTGLGDTAARALLSPVKPTKSGWITVVGGSAIAFAHRDGS